MSKSGSSVSKQSRPTNIVNLKAQPETIGDMIFYLSEVKSKKKRQKKAQITQIDELNSRRKTLPAWDPLMIKQTLPETETSQSSI